MIGTVTTPKTKGELIRNIQSLRNPKIEVLEVLGRSDKNKLNKLFDREIVKGNFSIILIKE